jgi:hypothetical protein
MAFIPPHPESTESDDTIHAAISFSRAFIEGQGKKRVLPIQKAGNIAAKKVMPQLPGR